MKVLESRGEVGSSLQIFVERMHSLASYFGVALKAENVLLCILEMRMYLCTYLLLAPQRKFLVLFLTPT